MFPCVSLEGFHILPRAKYTVIQFVHIKTAFKKWAVEGVNSSMIYLIHCKNHLEMPQCTLTQHNNKKVAFSNIHSFTYSFNYSLLFLVILLVYQACINYPIICSLVEFRKKKLVNKQMHWEPEN
jgi:hypothetical protein